MRPKKRKKRQHLNLNTPREKGDIRDQFFSTSALFTLGPGNSLLYRRLSSALFSSFSGAYHLEASSMTIPGYDVQKCPVHYHMSPAEADHPQLRSTHHKSHCERMYNSMLKMLNMWMKKLFSKKIGIMENWLKWGRKAQ